MTGLVGTEFLSRVLITDKYFATSDDNPSVKIVIVIHAIFLNTLRDIVDNEWNGHKHSHNIVLRNKTVLKL